MRTAKAIKAVLLLVACFCVKAEAKKKKDIPAAPLPAAISSAKKVFLANGGGNPLAFDEFYSKMKQWDRFQIVGSPSEADLVLELRYFVQDNGTHVWSSTNTYTGQTHVYSAHLTDPQLMLNVYSASSKDLLWSATDHRRLARMEKNRDKETINSADRLVDDLRARITDPPIQQ